MARRTATDAWPPPKLLPAIGTIAALIITSFITVATASQDYTAAGWLAPVLVLLIGCLVAAVTAGKASPPTRRQIRRRASVVGGLLLVSLVVPFAGPGWASAWRYDNTNPSQAGCADQDVAVVVDEWPVLSKRTGATIATVRWMHSPECDTSWVRVRTTEPDASATKTIQRPGQFLLWFATTPAVTDPPTDEWTFGPQLHTTGCAIITVTITVEDEEEGVLTEGC